MTLHDPPCGWAKLETRCTSVIGLIQIEMILHQQIAKKPEFFIDKSLHSSSELLNRNENPFISKP
jgi:hypothetical protein